MQRIYNILVSLLGESKQGGYDKGTYQYQWNCPWCADDKGAVDNKYNLEISFSLGKYHCWSCGHSGPLSRLIKSRGGKEYFDEYQRIITDLRESKYYNIDLFKDNCDFFEEQFIKLPKTFQKINISTCRDKALVEYLNKRRITQDIIDKYNIGRTTWDEEDWGWRNRIIIPSYTYSGDLNYYIGRTYKKNDKRTKYKNCTADKNNIVFCESVIQWDADIYLVEGGIDCIYYPNALSMLGKSLKDNTELYNQLANKANSNVVICLDSDTELEETKRIYETLNKGRLTGRVKYVKMGEDEGLPWKDFGEAYEAEGKEGIIKIMKSAKYFTTIEIS